MKLEIIGFNIESCIAAQDAGANRIELCANPLEGGTTPSYGFIKAAREKLSIELYVMIRPRGGDFLYSNDEFEIMKKDIELCKQSGCDGIVLGLLKTDGTIDKKRCRQLVDYAYPLGVTFHRAFDRTKDPFQSMEDIIEIGCERILTSGLRPKAIDGVEIIKQLILQADDRMIIMPGSGVSSKNITSLAESTGAVEFHSSASIFTASNMKYENESMGEKTGHLVVNKEEVKKMVDLLEQFSNSAIA
ncbi:copper homeostasis protein CutC [Ginsengibacter hankyongi]|uniref:PF03932 family protein CutC n=1 Tax=Ginsengibacter hankyongi TaxID=2607284 RepID=A0A5J5IM81_9BACT|nr:copper homeostasis protein CutC [Ginsengibacter hankyongi]KAA9040984.1 copper homeostasis protein CutC [Ginsengibacter hankyongi]